MNEEHKTPQGQQLSTADLAYGHPKNGNASGHPEEHESENVALISENEIDGYRQRWMSIQTQFIDSPRDTVSDADGLVAEVIQSLATRFADQRSNLEGQWQNGSEASTEDLRQAMQHYRSFFERLLAA